MKTILIAVLTLLSVIGYSQTQEQRKERAQYYINSGNTLMASTIDSPHTITDEDIEDMERLVIESKGYLTILRKDAMSVKIFYTDNFSFKTVQALVNEIIPKAEALEPVEAEMPF